jgi:hypothetical protein
VYKLYFEENQMAKDTVKDIGEGLIIQKQIIKEIINPFFKNNGFSRKGVRYIKKLDYFIIEVEIQRQRYDKDEGIENFRINMSVYSENSYRLFYGSMTFGGYSIAGKNSWITTDENTNIDELKIWLNDELNKLPAIFEKYNDIDKIIEENSKSDDYQDGIDYAFLLKDNNKINEFKLWVENKNEKIEGLKRKNIELSQQLESLEPIKKETIKNEIEYGKLWGERRSNEIKIEFIEEFFKKING